MTRHATDLSSPRAWHQFDLRGLFLFFVGWAMYFAVVASLRESLVPSPRAYDYSHPPVNWIITLVTIPISWVVLRFLYRRWGLRQALIIHYLGPVLLIAGVLVVAFFVGLDALAHKTRPEVVLRAVPHFLFIVFIAGVAGCALSTLVSFPAAILMLLYLARESHRTHRA